MSNGTCAHPGCRTTVSTFSRDIRKRLCPTHRREHEVRTHEGAGDGHHLTAEQIAECRRRLSRFESPLAIASDLGVTRQTVLNAAKRRAS